MSPWHVYPATFYKGLTGDSFFAEFKFPPFYFVERVPVRIDGIAAPEPVGPLILHGQQAAGELERFLRGKELQLSVSEDEDLIGRFWCSVLVVDPVSCAGEDLATLLLSARLVKPWPRGTARPTFDPSEPYPYAP